MPVLAWVVAVGVRERAAAAALVRFLADSCPAAATIGATAAPTFWRTTALVGTDVALARGGVPVTVGVAVAVGGFGAAKPRSSLTVLLEPNVENRKSPVTGSMKAPSAPVRPSRTNWREPTLMSPFESRV